MDEARNGVKLLSLKKVVFSLIMSILLWTIVTNAWGYTKFFNASSGSWSIYIFDFFSRLVWATPAVILLLKYRNNIPTTFKQLFTNIPKMKPLIITVLVVVWYNVCAMLYNHGGLWISPNFQFTKHFFMFAAVAFAEELVYRGWGFNALSAFVSEKSANIISTIFFILLHLPAYFIRYFLYGTFPVQTVVTQCAFVLVLGLLFGYLYCKGKSLRSCILVHFLSDFLSVMLIG